MGIKPFRPYTTITTHLAIQANMLERVFRQKLYSWLVSTYVAVYILLGAIKLGDLPGQHLPADVNLILPRKSRRGYAPPSFNNTSRLLLHCIQFSLFTEYRTIILA